MKPLSKIAKISLIIIGVNAMLFTQLSLAITMNYQGVVNNQGEEATKKGYSRNTPSLS